MYIKYIYLSFIPSYFNSFLLVFLAHLQTVSTQQIFQNPKPWFPAWGKSRSWRSLLRGCFHGAGVVPRDPHIQGKAKPHEQVFGKEIKPVNPKGNQPWIFTGRTGAEAAMFWLPNAKI